jgi:hypothetical protein
MARHQLCELIPLKKINVSTANRKELGWMESESDLILYSFNYHVLLPLSHNISNVTALSKVRHSAVYYTY